MKQTIFFLENDFEFMERVVNVLEQEYEILTAQGVIDGWNILENNKDRIIFLLIDIMMTVDGMFDREEAQGGLLSGVLFYKKICNELYKDTGAPPAIFLTALKLDLDKTIEDHLKGFNYYTIMKKDLAPSLEELADKIKVILKEFHSKNV